MVFFFDLFGALAPKTCKSAIVALPTERSEGGRERGERCRWQMKRPERVAAVGEQRSRTVGKAHTGHRNRGAMGAPPVAGGDADCHVAALLAMTTRCGAAVKYRKRRNIL